MTPEAVLAALALPQASRIDQRVPKKTLLEHAAMGSADKRLVTDGIARIQWVAVLKPATVGVPAFSNADREYLEIAVLQLTLRSPARSARLIELMHRTIPYPLLLLTGGAVPTSLSLAHKRRALNEAAAVVVDGELATTNVDPIASDIRPAFTAALAVAHQPQVHLHALYQGWIDVLAALEAARITGRFTVLDSGQRNRRRREALQQLRDLDIRIKTLRAAVGKTSQMARQVEINLQLQKLNREVEQLTGSL